MKKRMVTTIDTLSRMCIYHYFGT